MLRAKFMRNREFLSSLMQFMLKFLHTFRIHIILLIKYLQANQTQ